MSTPAEFEVLGLFKRHHRFVNANTAVALGGELGKKGCKPLLHLPANGRHYHQTRPFGQLERLVDHGGNGLGLERHIVRRAIGGTRTGKEHTQMIGNLRHCPHSRSRIGRSAVLIDRNRGREPLDAVHVGTRHQLEELSCVDGKALDVAALAFRIKRIEGERTLPRPRKPCENNQATAREVDGDVLQIVRSSAPNGNDVHLRSPILKENPN